MLDEIILSIMDRLEVATSRDIIEIVKKEHKDYVRNMKDISLQRNVNRYLRELTKQGYLTRHYDGKSFVYYKNG